MESSNDTPPSLEADFAVLSLAPETTFRFFDLPSEIRVKIYKLVLFSPKKRRVRGQPRPYPLQRIAMFLASRRFHDEASHCLYSSVPFNVFPIQGFRERPSLVELPRKYKPPIRTLTLNLGSSWTRPPASWVVRKQLGLPLMERVHTLEIFVQCDPSHPVFEGFRISSGFYTNFAGGLLRQVLEALPNLKWVQFDGNPSVEKDGELMTRLLSETRNAGLKILWGPNRGWKEETLRKDRQSAAIRPHIHTVQVYA